MTGEVPCLLFAICVSLIFYNKQITLINGKKIKIETDTVDCVERKSMPFRACLKEAMILCPREDLEGVYHHILTEVGFVTVNP